MSKLNTVTHEQYSELCNFKLFLQLGSQVENYQYWREKLDSLGISWAMQNKVSEIASDARNNDRYLYQLLQIDVITSK